MKYLKKYNEHYTKDEVTNPDLLETITEIEDILEMDLKKDDWVFYVQYAPKRWSDTYESDHMNITIKKKQNKSQCRFPEGSHFTLNDVPEVYRLLSVYKDHKIKIRICQDGDDNYYRTLPKYITGSWKDLPVQFMNIANRDEKILGIMIDIFLDGENLDQK